MLSWKCYRRGSPLTISLTRIRKRQFPETGARFQIEKHPLIREASGLRPFERRFRRDDGRFESP
jgi:hypothetical protein